MSSQSGEDAIIPSFALSVYESEDGLTLRTHTTEQPSVRKFASLGLFFGLAIMTLEREGVIEAKVNELMSGDPVNEVDVVNRITLLLKEDSNVLPA